MSQSTDKTTNIIRFGCGAIFGGVLLIDLFLELLMSELYIRLALYFIILISFFGYLSMRYGDRFWRAIGDLYED